MKKVLILLIVAIMLSMSALVGCDSSSSASETESENDKQSETQENVTNNQIEESEELSTQKQTENTTQTSAESLTEEPTEESTEEPTEESTEEPTEESTEESTEELTVPQTETQTETEEETKTKIELIPSYITNENVNYDVEYERIRLVFSVLDQNREFMSTNAVVKVSIVNESNVTVYTGSHTVMSWDFTSWVWEDSQISFWGIDVCIYTKDILAGVTYRGTISFTVETIDGTVIGEKSLTVYSGLPQTPYNNDAELTSISEIIDICNSLENQGASTPQKYLVEGTVTEIVNSVYGNVYIEDENGNRLFIYGMYDSTGKIRYDGFEKELRVGDKITLWGVLCNYDKPEMKNAWLINNKEIMPLTHMLDIHSIGNKLGQNEGTVEKYYVEGYITEITNYVYGNGYITDSYGNTLRFYGLFNETGDIMYGNMANAPEVGDKVIIWGIVFNYGGAELKDAWIVWCDN